MALLQTETERIVLASQSPRRIELLKKAISHFEVLSSNIDEIFDSYLTPQETVIQLSQRKAEQLTSQIDQGIIIGADSVVVIDNQILGKPKDYRESFDMLRLLSGKLHNVYTGISVIKMPARIVVSDFEVTEVKFRDLESWEIEKYIETNRPFDKAGSYGIQDDASVFVESIQGCYYNVVGLPLTKLFLILKRFLKNNKSHNS